MTAGTAGGAWTDLTGTEVRQRLEHRGWTPQAAADAWAAHERGDHRATSSITKALQR